MPSVGIGSELRRRGYPVSVITNPWFVPLVEEAGLDFIAVGERADYEKFLADSDLFVGQALRTPGSTVLDNPVGSHS